MKTLKTILLSTLIAIGLACGYSKPGNTPVAPGTVPSIAQLSPNAQAAGSAAFPLTVDGTNFNGKATISFNGDVLVTTRDSANELKAMVPASAIMNSGKVPVTVTNPGTPQGMYGGGTQAATSAAVSFVIN